MHHENILGQGIRVRVATHLMTESKPISVSLPVFLTDKRTPGVSIGNAEVSIAYANNEDETSGTDYTWCVEILGGPKCIGNTVLSYRGGNLQEGLTNLLTLLSLFGEVRKWFRIRAVGECGLFPDEISGWAKLNTEELSLLAAELSGTDALIRE